MDRYEVLKPIGAGKFAVVYKARRKADGALVALKRVAIDAMDERGRAKCLREVGAVGMLMGGLGWIECGWPWRGGPTNSHPPRSRTQTTTT